MEISDKMYVEILKEKLEDIQKQIKKTKRFIDLYKDWHLGSPMQQRTRKKSFDKNTENLPILESKEKLIKNMIEKYERFIKGGV